MSTDRIQSDDWPAWYPAACPDCGARFMPGTVSLSWRHCTCPGAGEARGHQMLYCRQIGCHWHRYPPEHVEQS